MRLAITAWLILTALLQGQDAVGDKLRVSLSAPRAHCWVREAVEVTIRVEVEADFFESNLIQLFRQNLDLPLDIVAPWFEVHDYGLGENRASLVINGRRGAATDLGTREIEGRSFRVFELKQRRRPEAEEREMKLAASARVVYATKFEEDFINGRQPLDRQEALVEAEVLVLPIRKLPPRPEGMPYPVFVGRMEIRASIDREELRLGESLLLRVLFEGDEAARIWDTLPYVLRHPEGFVSTGGLKLPEDPRDPRGVVGLAHDLKPVSEDVDRVPSLGFLRFDPTGEGRYHLIRTPEFPIRVLPAEPGADLGFIKHYDPQFGRSDDDSLHDFASSEGRLHRVGSPTLILGLILPWFMAAALFFWRRAREHDRRDPDRVRARRARESFDAATASDDWDVVEVFSEYLGAKLRLPAAAMIDPGLADRLEKSGIDGELAERCAAFLDEQVTARYGGATGEGARDAARSLVKELEGRSGARRLALPLLFAAVVTLAPSAEMQPDGDTAYAAGRYREAIAEYQQQLESTAEPAPGLLVRMGNCAYRLRRYSEALHYYRRARLRLPRSDELADNLRLAQDKLGIDRSADNSIGDLIVRPFSLLTPCELLWIVAILKTVSLIGLVFWFRRRGPRYVLVALLLLALGGAVQLGVAQWTPPDPTAIVLPRRLPIRSQPDVGLDPVVELTAGEEVRVEESNERWLRVRHSRGRGWVERSGLGIID